MHKWLDSGSGHQQRPYFEKKMTNINKGIALIIMFIAHFFTEPNWWVDGIYYPTLAGMVSKYAILLMDCVYIFCFLTGYFYFYAKKKTIQYSIGKIIDLLIIYWGVFFLLAILAVITTGYHYKPVNFLLEMFAIRRPTMLFCWYVFFYYSFMLIFPFVANKMLSRGILTDLLTLAVIAIVVRIILRVNSMFFMNSILEDFAMCMTRFPKVIVGYLFAKYSLFERLEDFNKRLIPSKACNIIIWILMLFLVPGVRYFTSMLDSLTAPFFIYAVVNLARGSEDTHLSKVLIKIGKYSVYMWFLHCIFFNNAKEVFQPILYLPRNPVLVLIWGLFICYVVSFVLEIGLSRIIKAKNALRHSGPAA